VKERDFNEDTWFDSHGSFHSDALHVVNRNREKNYEIWEDSRHEGEVDVEHILTAGRKDKAAGITGTHEHRREGR
jgi:hypothetical protein